MGLPLPAKFGQKGLVGQILPSGSGNRYQCPYCSKRFSRPSSLRIHIYSHTGRPLLNQFDMGGNKRK
ncbi:unnamed protein product [Rhizophagus irregularis]|nr:unnamed protein product [Rhizophagus irregularis]